jgi:hypothetical protein
LQFEFVSGILVFVSIEGAPGPQGFRALRPRLAEVAVVQAPLAPNLNHQYFKLSHAELVAIRSDDLKFTPDGALKGMIRKSKTDQTNTAGVGSYLVPRGAPSWSGSG